MVGGKPVAYYSTAGAAYGLPLGTRAKSEVVLFMKPEALQAFRAGPGWEVGADGDVTLVRLAAGGGIEGSIAGEPILGFIFTEQGLAGGLTLDGARFTRLAR
jgi:lipid-binding SYLF domain-containing protein